MEFVLALKALWRRRRYVGPGLVLVLLLTTALVFQGFPAQLSSREHRVWQANAQILVDAQTSAVGNLNQGLDPLIPRATVYANIMTSTALAALIGQTSHLPAAQITVIGPIGTNGQRPQHGATVLVGGAARYTLQLSTDETQPIIRVAATAPTARSALALANGAAGGLSVYVGQAERSQAVIQRHRVDIRQLGAATVSPSDSGLKPVYFIPILIALSIAWCMLVLLVSRFRRTWQIADDELPEIIPPTTSELDLLGAAPAWWLDEPWAEEAAIDSKAAPTAGVAPATDRPGGEQESDAEPDSGGDTEAEQPVPASGREGGG